MAGLQIIEPTVGSTDWTGFSTMFNHMMKGLISISLANWGTTDPPSIKPGSLVEVAGSLFYFGDTEAISGTSSPSTNRNYIMLTSSSSQITASLTTNLPVWVPSKHGWYDATSGFKRYIGGCATDLNGKWIYETGEQNNRLIISGVSESYISIYTISSAEPSGGADGDIWFTRES